MPVPYSGGNPDHISGPDFFDRSTFLLHAAQAVLDDERLPGRMRMPGSAGAGLESDDAAGDAAGLFGLEQRVQAHGAGESFGGTLPGWVGTCAGYFHAAMIMVGGNPSSPLTMPDMIQLPRKPVLRR